MKNNTMKTISAVVALVLICVLGWAFFGRGGSAAPSSGAPAQATLPQTYESGAYRFSFSYPAGLKASEFPSPDGTGDVVLIADPQTGIGMQAYITPFDEPAENLTVERVKSSLPDVAVADAHEMQVGGSGKGVEFRTGSGADEKAQEWFVAGGNLYQVTAPTSFAGTLEAMISTWKFQ